MEGLCGLENVEADSKIPKFLFNNFTTSKYSQLIYQQSPSLMYKVCKGNKVYINMFNLILWKRR